MNLKDLKKEKLLVLGFGKEGKDTYSYLKKHFPDKKIIIADKKELKDFNLEDQRVLKQEKSFLGEKYLEALDESTVVFKTAGIPLGKIKSLVGKEQTITSQDKFFIENCPGKIIGITGTKGKGTTASIVYSILKKSRENVFLVGNIGEPRLKYLDRAEEKSIFVYELSARQLQLLDTGVDIAVFLNFYPAHLDYYKSLEEYKKAKEKIITNQKQESYLIYNHDQKVIRQMAEKSKAKKITFSLKEKKDLSLKNGWLCFQDKKIIKEEKIPLKGRFNLSNTLAAIGVAEVLKIKKEKIEKGIIDFTPLPHRLEFVGQFKQIDFYNDSLATLPEPVILALETIKNTQTIILGGYEAGQDFNQLARKIAASNVENIILFPPTGKRIKEKIKEFSSDKNFFRADSMKEAVRWAYEKTKKGKSVLLSPAAPSFGVFKNYKQRGNLFKKWVKKYGQEKKN